MNTIDTTETITTTATPRQIAARKAARTRMIRRAAKAARAALRKAARGCYQYRLARDLQTWSGSDLRGAANKWGAGYLRSRCGLLDRAQKGLAWRLTLDLCLVDHRWHSRPVITIVDGTGAELTVGVFEACEVVCHGVLS